MQNVSNAVNPRQHSKNTYEIFSLDLTFIQDNWERQQTHDIRCRELGGLEFLLLNYKFGSVYDNVIDIYPCRKLKTLVGNTSVRLCLFQIPSIQDMYN